MTVVGVHTVTSVVPTAVRDQALYYLFDSAIFLQKAKLFNVDGDLLALRSNRLW